MRYGIILCLLAIMLVFAGCGDKGDPNIDYSNDVKGDDGSGNVKLDIDNKGDQEAVNFKCDVENMGTISFFKGDAVVETPNGKTWIIGDDVYVVMNLNERDVLIKYSEGSGMEPMTKEDMRDTYKTSKMTPGVDCTLDVVTQADVTLPELEILTEQGFQDELMAEMTKGMQ